MRSPVPRWFGVLLLAWLPIACAYHAPDAPTPITPNTTTVPFALNLGAAPGATAGSTVLTAKVQNGNGAAMSGVVVSFSTDIGTLSPSSVTTTAGQAVSTLTSTSGSASAVTATAGSLSTRLIVTTPGTVPVFTPPPPNVPSPPPTLGSLAVTISATSGIVGTSTIFTGNIVNGSGRATVTWDYGDGTAGTTTSATSAHTYGAVGSYLTTALVRDDDGRSASATTVATVTAAPVPPPTPAAALAITLTCIPGTHLTTATACNVSVTYGGTPVLPSAFTLVAWSFGDGSQSSALLGSHVYPQAGTYPVVVTVGTNTVDGSKTGTTSTSVIIP
jgi:hypothetical protein